MKCPQCQIELTKMKACRQDNCFLEQEAPVVPTVPVWDGDAATGFEFAPVDVPDKPTIKINKSFFKDTAFGRTLSLRNKTGKVLAGVLTTSIAIVSGIDVTPILELLTGNDMDLISELVQNLNWMTIATFLVGLVLAFVTAKGWFSAQMSKEFKEVWGKYRDARLPVSEGGSKITQKEKAALFDEVIDFIEATLKKFGIELDLNGDGK